MKTKIAFCNAKGYHFASLAIRTNAMIMFKNKNIADAHSSTSSTVLFLYLLGATSAWLLTRNKQRSNKKRNDTTRFLHVYLYVHSQQVMHGAFDCVTHITFLCSCAFWVLLRTIVRSTHFYLKPGGLILNLESQLCDCHLIVIRSKLASALVSFLQLIIYYPTQSVHVAYQGTAGVVIVYDIESRHGC